MFYREGAGFAVEEVRPYGPNVLSFEVVTGRRRWYIIRCYLAPDDARTIEQVALHISHICVEVPRHYKFGDFGRADCPRP